VLAAEHSMADVAVGSPLEFSSVVLIDSIRTFYFACSLGKSCDGHGRYNKSQRGEAPGQKWVETLVCQCYGD